MAKFTKRITLNREVVARVRLILADGLYHVGLNILEQSRPPDPPPIGVGLIQAGGVVAYVDGHKVADSTSVPDEGKYRQQDTKPRAAKLPNPGIMVIVGYGFPARFVHNGTIHIRPNPFLARSGEQVSPRAPEIMGTVVRPLLARGR